jgi:hypothetical protein
MKRLALFFLVLTLLVGCDSPEEVTSEETTPEESAEETTDQPAESGDEHELAEDMEPGETRHFGAPFAIEADPVDLAEVLTAALEVEDYSSDEPVKVSARVNQVCQNKGCWFTLSTDAVDIPVRVRMLDYAFFVSRNTDGAEAIIEGTLARTTISQDLAQHFADDVAEATGEEAEVVEGEQDTFEFTATGISLTLSDV